MEMASSKSAIGNVQNEPRVSCAGSEAKDYWGHVTMTWIQLERTSVS